MKSKTNNTQQYKLKAEKKQLKNSKGSGSIFFRGNGRWVGSFYVRVKIYQVAYFYFNLFAKSKITFLFSSESESISLSNSLSL